LERYFRYRYTQYGNPVTQEGSGVTENGNVVCMETQDQSNAENVTHGNVEGPCDPIPRELRDASRDPRMGTIGSNQKPIQELEPLKCPQALSSQPELNSAGNSLPEHMEHAPRCVACRKNIQVYNGPLIST
jgi:hypothetical protein